MAPCVDRKSWDAYQQNIMMAREILKGNTRKLSQMVYDEMMRKAEEMKFEEAEELKRQYMMIEQFCAKSEVVSHTITDVDVFCIDDDDNRQNAFINYMHVTNGTINQSFTYEYKRKLEETDEDLLLSAIIEIRERFKSKAKEIIVPFSIDWQMDDASFFTPQRGDKHHLLELSLMNCKQYRIDRLKQADKLNPEQKYTRLMKELQDKLGLQKLPYRIELFDNSNISGSDAVAGMVVYKGMKKSKQDYRKYNIKTVEGPDDYASMQEVTFRRYRDGEDLPDLIICDGGIGQMHCVREVVEDQLHLNIPIAGLAKNDKHRTQELLFLKDNGAGEKETITIQLKPESELFKILTQMQDEVHRYAISFHRDKRSKHALQSELDNIPGIGPKTKEILLQKYKTVKNIRAACGGAPSDVTALIGPAKVKVLTDYFSENNGENVSRGT